MISPGPLSPLRPIISAFYRASLLVSPDDNPAACLRLLSHELAADGLHAITSPSLPLDLVVDDSVGLLLLPSSSLLTDDARRCTRAALSASHAPPVALLLAFFPQPRLRRVDAPRSPESR